MKDNTVFWKMRNGKLISVDDMDINHLRNTLKMIIRNSQRVQTTCPHNATQALEMEDIEMEVGITDFERGIL
jgi:hypothetical protein